MTQCFGAFDLGVDFVGAPIDVTNVERVAETAVVVAGVSDFDERLHSTHYNPRTKAYAEHMGDRSNVLFRNGESGVGVYAHWGGAAMAEAVASVIDRPAFQKRIGDPSYATRIGVQGVLELLGADSMVDTGFGLWTPEGGADDNEYPCIVVDVMDGSVFVAKDYRFVDRSTELIDPPTAKALRDAMRG